MQTEITVDAKNEQLRADSTSDSMNSYHVLWYVIVRNVSIDQRGFAMPTVSVKRLPNGADLPLPAYQTEGAAGLDLLAAVDEPIVLNPLERRMVPTGIAIALPEGYEAQVRPRSGLAAKHGISIVNAPGTVDADYRGEIKVLLVNLSQEPFTIGRGDRIAQMVVAPVSRAILVEELELASTARGAGGFGSTGRI